MCTHPPPLKEYHPGVLFWEESSKFVLKLKGILRQISLKDQNQTYNRNFYFNYGANTHATREGSLLEPYWLLVISRVTLFELSHQIPQRLNGNITKNFQGG